MVKQGPSSKGFFRVILTETIESGNLELPTSFLKKHGKNLSSYATLKVPSGEESKMEIKRSKGKAWLHKGWTEFVVKYSIKCRYFLVFRYKGGSRFSVLIFDHTSSEILYPPSSANSCELVQVKEEDSDDDEILDEHPHKFQRVSENLDRSSARDRVLEKAKAFQSSNLHFFVMIRSASMFCLYIPSEPGRICFGGDKRNNVMKLIREDGRTWSMNYNIGNSPRNRVRVGSGWPEFLKENGVQEGDVCVFELVNSITMTFKVTLFRTAEHEEANKKDLLQISTASASCKNKRVSSIAASTAIERVENFKCKDPHFIIRMTPCYISGRGEVHIPLAHSRKYLKNEESVTIIDGSNGKNWLVCLRPKSNTGIVTLAKGWKDYASENQLQEGDFVEFEMMNDKAGNKAYKANIIRS